MSEETTKQFNIQKIYLKDISFESPSSPAAFNQQPWDPKLDLNMNNTNSELGDNRYEVVLRMTLTASHDEQTSFLIEIQQAGIFIVAGFSEDETKYLLGSQCASILFPYVREQISDLTVRGGFPPLVLAPVNFDALYQQHLKQNQGGAAEEIVDAS